MELVAVGLVLVRVVLPPPRAFGHLGSECRFGNRSRPPGVVVLRPFRRIRPLRSHLASSGSDRSLIVVEIELVAVEEHRPRSKHTGERSVEADELLEAEPVQRRRGDRGVVRSGGRQFRHPVGPQIRVDELEAFAVSERTAPDGEQHRVGVDRDHLRAGDAVENACAQRTGSAPKVEDAWLRSRKGRNRIDHRRESLFAIRDVALLLRVPSRQPGGKVGARGVRAHVGR